MKIDARTRTLTWLRADIDLRESDVQAILELLGSARLSVESHGDNFCAGILEQCAAQLRQRHGFLGTPQAGNPVWTESSLPALVHAADTLVQQASHVPADEFAADAQAVQVETALQWVGLERSAWELRVDAVREEYASLLTLFDTIAA